MSAKSPHFTVFVCTRVFGSDVFKGPSAHKVCARLRCESHKEKLSNFLNYKMNNFIELLS